MEREMRDNNEGKSHLLDETEVARLLAVSPRTLQAWRQHGSGPPYIRLSRLIRYRMEDIQRFLAERTHDGEEQ